MSHIMDFDIETGKVVNHTEFGRQLQEFAETALEKISPQVHPMFRSWQRGLCLLFARALHKWSDGGLEYAVIRNSRYPANAAHVLCHVGEGVYLDGDGAATAEDQIEKAQKLHGCDPGTYLEHVLPDADFGPIPYHEAVRDMVVDLLVERFGHYDPQVVGDLLHARAKSILGRSMARLMDFDRAAGEVTNHTELGCRIQEFGSEVMNVIVPEFPEFKDTWQNGGCLMFARALQEWAGGETRLAVIRSSRYPEIVQHTVCQIGEDLYADSDGIGTGDEMARKSAELERVAGAYLEAADEATDMGEIMDHPTLQARLVELMTERLGVFDLGMVDNLSAPSACEPQATAPN